MSLYYLNLIERKNGSYSLQERFLAAHFSRNDLNSSAGKEKIKEVEKIGISKIVLSIDKTELEDPLKVFATELIE